MLLPDALERDLREPLAHFAAHGWARLGRVLDDEGLEALRERADAIMLGEVVYPGLFFQLDSESGRYEDVAFGRGWEGPSLRYRKLEKLEKDPLFRAWMENALFERVVRALVASSGEVAVYRAVLFNKAQAGGSVLPWHQDAGKFWGLDRDPELQIWTALDDVGEDAGCIEVVSGSHRDGLATPLGGLVPQNLVAGRGADDRKIAVPARAGEALLIHNRTVRASRAEPSPSATCTARPAACERSAHRVSSRASGRRRRAELVGVRRRIRGGRGVSAAPTRRGRGP